MALEDYIRRFRSQLVRTIAWQQMKPEPPDIPATRAVLTNLAFVTVHPVSALSHYSILLDHFFERELFPRFEEARALRNVSVARKIGSLRESVGPHLKEELHLYGMALSQWSEQIVRKLEALVNSYADAYRVQLQGTNGFSGKNADPKQMETDLDRLVHWNAEQAPNLKAESTGMKE